MTDHWEAVRKEGRRALGEEAERRFDLKPSYDQGTKTEQRLMRQAFIEGGEWVTEQFVKAMEIRGGLPRGSADGEPV